MVQFEAMQFWISRINVGLLQMQLVFVSGHPAATAKEVIHRSYIERPDVSSGP